MAPSFGIAREGALAGLRGSWLCDAVEMAGVVEVSSRFTSRDRPCVQRHAVPVLSIGENSQLIVYFWRNVKYY